MRLALILVAFVGMAGTYLPWVHTQVHETILGTDGEGLMTLGLFALILIIQLAAINDPEKSGRVDILSSAFAGGVVAWVGLYVLTLERVLNHRRGGLGGDERTI